MDEQVMHSQINQDLLDHYNCSAGFDLAHLDTFRPATNKQELENLKEDPAVHIYEKYIPAPNNAPDIKIRIYEPADRGTELLPCGLFFHGGGFLFGSVYRQNDMCIRYVKNVNMIIISVEYRLAPEYKSPSPIEDAYTALLWLDKNGIDLGADTSRTAIIGLSAGGCIVSALALMTRDRQGPMPVIQIPLYAMLDSKSDTLSQHAITSEKVWCHNYSKIAWDLYIDKNSPPDCYTSPILAENLTGLPPVFSYIGTLDPFLDENIEYWNKLIRAGIPVEYHIFPGCYHSFEIAVPESAYGQIAYELTYSALKRAFGI